MSYLGDISLFAGNFEPAGWYFCDGRLLPISGFDMLYTLIGTTYGGDGVSTFALPDLRGRVPIHQGAGYNVGEIGGTESVTLNAQQIPAHNHAFYASSDASTGSMPENSVLGNSPSLQMYRNATPAVQMYNGSLAVTGDSQPHDNRQLTGTVNYIICVNSVFPTSS